MRPRGKTQRTRASCQPSPLRQPPLASSPTHSGRSAGQSDSYIRATSPWLRIRSYSSADPSSQRVSSSNSNRRARPPIRLAAPRWALLHWSRNGRRAAPDFDQSVNFVQQGNDSLDFVDHDLPTGVWRSRLDLQSEKLRPRGIPSEFIAPRQIDPATARPALPEQCRLASLTRPPEDERFGPWSRQVSRTIEHPLQEITKSCSGCSVDPQRHCRWINGATGGIRTRRQSEASPRWPRRRRWLSGPRVRSGARPLQQSGRSQSLQRSGPPGAPRRRHPLLAVRA